MTYVISDLHGYRFEKFLALLERAGVTAEDTLYILGDVVDRGDDGIEYLQWIPKQENVRFILGNHEYMMLACSFLLDSLTQEAIDSLTRDQFDDLRLWLHNGAQPTLTGLRRVLTRDPDEARGIFDFLSKAPLWAEVRVGEKDYVLVHGGLGGFSPDKPLSDYTAHDLVWTRPGIKDRYFEDKMTILGHTPTLFFGTVRAGELLFTDTWIDIDAGAAAGLPPVMLRLDDMEQFRA